MKPTAGVFSRGRRSFLVQKPEAPRGPAASLCPMAMFLSFALNALSRDNIVALPCQPPPPPHHDCVDESELVIGTAQGLGTSSSLGVEEFFHAAKQRGVCVGDAGFVLSHTLTFCFMWAPLSSAAAAATLLLYGSDSVILQSDSKLWASEAAVR